MVKSTVNSIDIFLLINLPVLGGTVTECCDNQLERSCVAMLYLSCTLRRASLF